MPDVRKYYKSQFIGAWDLERDATLTITGVEGGELHRAGSSDVDYKPILSFAKTDKRLVLNSTNREIIAKLYGSYKSEVWIGKRITLYATTTKLARKVVDCVRVRPTVPKGPGTEPQPDPAPTAIAEMDAAPVREPGEDGAEPPQIDATGIPT